MGLLIGITGKLTTFEIFESRISFSFFCFLPSVCWVLFLCDIMLTVKRKWVGTGFRRLVFWAISQERQNGQHSFREREQKRNEKSITDALEWEYHFG